MRFSLCTPLIKSSKFLINRMWPRTSNTSETVRESPKADERRKHCTAEAKAEAREADGGSVEAQRAAREEVGEEEEGVPEDESLPHQGERHASTRIGVGANRKYSVNFKEYK